MIPKPGKDIFCGSAGIAERRACRRPINLFERIWLTCIFLQAVANLPAEPAAAVHSGSYFSLLMKGADSDPDFPAGGLAIFIISDKWYMLRKLGKHDSRAFGYLLKLIYAGDSDKAGPICRERTFPSFKVVEAGLENDNRTLQDVEESMQIQARLQISKMEKGMNYLPYRVGRADAGLFGNDFRVIRIFYDISKSGCWIFPRFRTVCTKNDLLCTGLLVGIIAYSGVFAAQ